MNELEMPKRPEEPEKRAVQHCTVASQSAVSARQARTYLRKFRGLDLIEELYWAITQEEWRRIAELPPPHTRNDLNGVPRKAPAPAITARPGAPVRRRRQRTRVNPNQLPLFPK